jgi:hypothetical protein
MQYILSTMGWNVELEELGVNVAFDNPVAKPTRRPSRKTYIRINLDDADNEPRVKSVDESDGSADLAGAYSATYERAATKIAETSKHPLPLPLLPISSKLLALSRERRKSSLMFSSLALMQLLPADADTRLMTLSSLEQFHNVTIEVLADGALIVRFDSGEGSGLGLESLLCFPSCKKVLCMRCSSPINDSLHDVDVFADVESIAMGISVTFDTSNGISASGTENESVGSGVGSGHNERFAQSPCRENMIM